MLRKRQAEAFADGGPIAALVDTVEAVGIWGQVFFRDTAAAIVHQLLNQLGQLLHRYGDGAARRSVP
jgi:hypothetical protein